jgi:hypothetical protein
MFQRQTQRRSPLREHLFLGRDIAFRSFLEHTGLHKPLTSSAFTSPLSGMGAWLSEGAIKRAGVAIASRGK